MKPTARSPEQRSRRTIDSRGRPNKLKLGRLLRDFGYTELNPETAASIESRLASVGLTVAPSLSAATDESIITIFVRYGAGGRAADPPRVVDIDAPRKHAENGRSAAGAEAERRREHRAELEERIAAQSALQATARARTVSEPIPNGGNLRRRAPAARDARPATSETIPSQRLAAAATFAPALTQVAPPQTVRPSDVSPGARRRIASMGGTATAGEVSVAPRESTTIRGLLADGWAAARGRTRDGSPKFTAARGGAAHFGLKFPTRRVHAGYRDRGKQRLALSMVAGLVGVIALSALVLTSSSDSPSVSTPDDAPGLVGGGTETKTDTPSTSDAGESTTKPKRTSSKSSSGASSTRSRQKASKKKKRSSSAGASGSSAQATPTRATPTPPAPSAPAPVRQRTPAPPVQASPPPPVAASKPKPTVVPSKPAPPALPGGALTTEGET